MGKPKKCTLLLNTRNGYVLQPIECKSIAEAMREARESELAYRIVIDGKVVKSGWIVR